MNFVALDVETANADMASICSIGVAVFENGIITTEWYSLVDPQDFFDGLNVSIHGIKENDVRDAPTFKDVFPALSSIVGDLPIVTHMHFDRVAIAQASARYSQQPLTNRWLDSAKVARRTWEECARSGYGLRNLCKIIGYSFRHHNALEDAKACGQVLLAAMKHSGLDRPPLDHPVVRRENVQPPMLMDRYMEKLWCLLAPSPFQGKKQKMLRRNLAAKLETPFRERQRCLLLETLMFSV